MQRKAKAVSADARLNYHILLQQLMRKIKTNFVNDYYQDTRLQEVHNLAQVLVNCLIPCNAYQNKDKDLIQAAQKKKAIKKTKRKCTQLLKQTIQAKRANEQKAKDQQALGHIQARKIVQYLNAVSTYIVKGKYDQNEFALKNSGQSYNRKKRPNVSIEDLLKKDQNVQLWEAIRNRLKNSSNQIVRCIYQEADLQKMRFSEVRLKDIYSTLQQSFQEVTNRGCLTIKESTHTPATQIETLYAVLQKFKHLLLKKNPQEQLDRLRRILIWQIISIKQRQKIRQNQRKKQLPKKNKNVENTVSSKCDLSSKFMVSKYSKLIQNKEKNNTPIKVGRAVSYQQFDLNKSLPSVSVQIQPRRNSLVVFGEHKKSDKKKRQQVLIDEWMNNKYAKKAVQHITKKKYSNIFRRKTLDRSLLFVNP